MKKTILFFALIQFLNIPAQNKIADKYAFQLDSVKVKMVLDTLASNSFLGRDAGKYGGLLTETYLSQYAKKIGLLPGMKTSYLQNIGIYDLSRSNTARLQISGFDLKKDYRFSNKPTADTVLAANEVVFIGYGMHVPEYNEICTTDLKNKVVMMLNGNPKDKFGNALVNTSQSIDEIKRKEPRAILLVNDQYDTFYKSSSDDQIFSSDLTNSRNSEKDAVEIEKQKQMDKVPVIDINRRLANLILEPVKKTINQFIVETEQKIVSCPVVINIPFEVSGDNRYKKSISGNNVIGYVEGTTLKDEYIVISAHHDHLGQNYKNIVCNGADDNASGVSAALEIARVLAKAKKEGNGPKRSVLIVLTTGEEDGLKGSNFYVNNPAFPLEKTKACINLDMLGREDKDSTVLNNNNVFVIFDKYKSGDLLSQLKTINANTTQMQISDRYSIGWNSLFDRSDNYNFGRKNVSSISLTSGIHKDYHETTDDSNLIHYEGLLKRTKLAFYLVWELANNIKSKEEETIKISTESR